MTSAASLAAPRLRELSYGWMVPVKQQGHRWGDAEQSPQIQQENVVGS